MICDGHQQSRQLIDRNLISSSHQIIKKPRYILNLNGPAIVDIETHVLQRRNRLSRHLQRNVFLSRQEDRHLTILPELQPLNERLKCVAAATQLTSDYTLVDHQSSGSWLDDKGAALGDVRKLWQILKKIIQVRNHHSHGKVCFRNRPAMVLQIYTHQCLHRKQLNCVVQLTIASVTP